MGAASTGVPDSVFLAIITMADLPVARTKRKVAQPAFARLAVADELGLLKVVEVPSGPAWDAAAIVQVWGQPNKDKSIQALAAPNFLLSPAEDVIAVSRRDGTGQLLSAHDGHVLAPLPLLPAKVKGAYPTASAEVKCLAFRQQPDHALGLVSCSTTGMLSVLSSSEQQGGEAQGEGTQAGWVSTSSMQTAPNVGCMALDQSCTSAAVGGEGCQMQVWSLSTGQQVFKAKGGKPNKVGNVDLPHLTALTFLPGDPTGQQVLVGTVKHKLWLYDLRAGQRPQMDLAWGDARITSLAAQQDGERVWVANGSGQVEALELRARRMQGSMKGAAGSVRSLTLHPDASQPLLASVSLDRFMRVHDTGTRASACKMYCKQQLAGVVWLRPLPVQAGEAEQGADGAGAEAQEAAQPSAARHKKSKG